MTMICIGRTLYTGSPFVYSPAIHFANTDVCNDSWRGTRGTSAFFVLMTRSRIGANCFNGLDCIQCLRALYPTSPPYRTLSWRFAHHEFTRLSPTILSPIEKAREKKWADEEAGMWSQFQQREALTEQTVVDRKVLADNNIIRINKETRQKIKGTESEWQGRASKWLATARRKVSLHAVCSFGDLAAFVYVDIDSLATKRVQQGAESEG